MKTSITLNNTEFDLKKSIQKLEGNLPEWEHDLFSFLVGWFSDTKTIEVQTSGSTGTPKMISKSKTAMRNSAVMTGEFFGFTNRKNALLCLPVKYIAGKMMLVRAIEWALELDYIEPKTVMDIPKKEYYFSAMTPAQVESNLASISNIKNLIIGGAPISSLLEKKLIETQGNKYATYGMTETVSHIALRKIGDIDYQTLSNISISVDKRNCLVIHAPKLLNEPIITNDLIEITSEKSFIWKGRLDHVINSGGVKISPELLEKKISDFISSPFFIAGFPDEKWGEKVVLLIESNSFNTLSLISSMENILPKTDVPKAIYFLDSFQYTENGKLRRKETLQLVLDKPNLQ